VPAAAPAEYVLYLVSRCTSKTRVIAKVVDPAGRRDFEGSRLERGNLVSIRDELQPAEAALFEPNIKEP
jgi:hypothetical protein